MITKLHTQNARKRQLGQGMSEYIIITALIALAAITVVGAFGNVVQEQFAAMAGALAGDEDVEAAESEAAATTPTLKEFSGADG